MQDGQDNYAILGHAKEIAVIMVHVRMAHVSVTYNGEEPVVKYLFAKTSVVSKAGAQQKVVSAIKDTEEMIVASDLQSMEKQSLPTEQYVMKDTEETLVKKRLVLWNAT